MSDIAVGIYGIIVLLALFLTGLEMAYCMILVGFVGFTFLMSFSAASNLVVKDFFDTFTTYSYTVIPLFIMMGELAQNSNIAKRLYVGAHKWIGHIPGRAGHDHRGGRNRVQGHVRLDPRDGRDLFRTGHS